LDNPWTTLRKPLDAGDKVFNVPTGNCEVDQCSAGSNFKMDMDWEFFTRVGIMTFGDHI
jgi:hypothetical protein